MLVLRGTKKLRHRIKSAAVGAQDTSTTVLGDWFATALFWRPQVVLLVNERTLLPVFVPLAPAATLIERIPEAIAAVLHRHGVDDAFVEAELAAMGEIRIGPTNNRSVVGVMNEFAIHGEFLWQEGLNDFEGLSVRMASLLLGPLDKRAGSPDRELAAVFRSERSNVIQFPQRTSAHQPPVAAVAPSTASVYQLKVTLLGTKPPVWRRVLVHGSTPLDQLHEVIQAAFGWWNYHLYEFEIARTRYGIPDPDWDYGPPTRNAHRTRLDKVAEVGASFSYTYDFGDAWEHKVTVEKTVPLTPGLAVPACTVGRRACPPEDCGGPWGYQDLLEILADPSHPEHEERVEWVGEWGGRLDPEAFDPAGFVDNLQNIRLAAFDD